MKKKSKKKSFKKRYNFVARGGVVKFYTPYDIPLWEIFTVSKIIAQKEMIMVL
jgi:hypothetical protein